MHQSVSFFLVLPLPYEILIVSLPSLLSPFLPKNHPCLSCERSLSDNEYTKEGERRWGTTLQGVVGSISSTTSYEATKKYKQKRK